MQCIGMNNGGIMRPISRMVLMAAALGLSAIAATVQAAPLSQITEWGTLDPSCTGEGVTCAADPAFTPSFGGYRAGGSVSWGFTFDPSAFASISSLELEVLVVGFYFEGNASPPAPLGNYLAIDAVPFAPFLNVTDHRDTRTFTLPVLSAGPHTFSVVAFSNEGWAGVDFARLTVTGESTAQGVPEPATLVLLGLGLAGLGFSRRKQ